MTTLETTVEAEVLAALATVMDPELDQPITELGFVRTLDLDNTGVRVHLRLPTAFCSPNFAYLMCSDAVDALRRVPGAGQVRVLLDGHHDSDKINAGLAAEAGYRGTFGAEAQESLDELRLIFQRKAHTAAMERACSAMLRRGTWTMEELPQLELLDLPEDAVKDALLRRRTAIGLPTDRRALVVVDEYGVPIPADELPLRLRIAATTRISIEGNSHFCRGLLATRYADEGPAGMTPTTVSNTRSTR